MNVLMINPNQYKQYVSPLGLEYVCNSLLRENIKFNLVDFNFEHESVVYKRLKENHIDLVGITIRNVDASNLVKNEFFVPRIKRLVERVKKTRDCYVVLGGAGYSFLPQEILEYTGADFGVVGYGEEIIPQLIAELKKDKNLSKIDNLVWRRNGEIVINKISKKGYEAIPTRSRNIVRNRDYFGVFGVGNIEVKRGCFKQCGFCAEPSSVGSNVVYHSIQNIIEEIKEMKNMGINYLYFCDSEFNIGSEEFNFHLCEEIIRSKLNIKWYSTINPDKNLSFQMLRLMKKAGCLELGLNPDSGSDEILLSMNKQHTVEDSIICAEKIKKTGILLISSYIVGWPGESKQTLDETVNLIKKIQAAMNLFYSGVRIYPNTKIQKIAICEGMITKDTNLLFPVFYNSKQVLNEFIPYLKRQTKDIPNCMFPGKDIDFKNLLIKNVYLQGYDGLYSQITDYVNSLSIGKKLKIISNAALDYILPFRSRFIPKADNKKKNATAIKYEEKNKTRAQIKEEGKEKELN